MSNIQYFYWKKRFENRSQVSFSSLFEILCSLLCRRHDRFFSDNVIIFLIIALLLIDYLPIRRFQANCITFVVYYIVRQPVNGQLQCNGFTLTRSYLYNNLSFFFCKYLKKSKTSVKYMHYKKR